VEQIIHIIHIRFLSHTVIDLSLGPSKKAQKAQKRECVKIR